MSEKYVPDETFVERLEWQLGSEYRRAALRNSAGGRIAVPRPLAAAALLAGLLTTGVTVIKASEVIKDSWRKKIEIARAETDLRLDQVRRDAARDAAARIENQFSLGLVREDEALTAKDAVRKAELALERSLLNKAEVAASGEGPRSEIYAPVVGGRDFVGERLALDIRHAAMDGAAQERRQERLTRLIQLGLISKEELGTAQAESSVGKALLDKLRKRLELRRRFVDGHVTAEQAEIEDRLAAAEENLQSARAKADDLKGRLAHLETLLAVGTISAAEVQDARAALGAAQAEQKLAALEIEVLGKMK
jgi:hypothetical protein